MKRAIGARLRASAASIARAGRPVYDGTRERVEAAIEQDVKHLLRCVSLLWQAGMRVSPDGLRAKHLARLEMHWSRVGATAKQWRAACLALRAWFAANGHRETGDEVERIAARMAALERTRPVLLPRIDPDQPDAAWVDKCAYDRAVASSQRMRRRIDELVSATGINRPLQSRRNPAS